MTKDAETLLEPRVVWAGPAAFYLYLGAEPGEGVSRLLAGLRRRLEPLPPGVREVIPGYASLLIEHDPASFQEELARWLLEACRGSFEDRPGREHALAVLYGAGADRDELVERLGLEWDDIVSLHQGASYTVAFIGFTPGFPYLLGLPEALKLPRRATPRKRVPAGSVAVAGAQAGVYPSESPGGWWVLGRTDAPLYTPRAEPPTLLAAGDTVRFRAVAELETPKLEPKEKEEAGAPSEPLLRVVRAWPKSASLQALPRWGVGAHGLAQAGALDALALEAANALVGNPEGALALELLAQPLELRTETDLTFAVAGGGFRLELDTRQAATWRAHGVAAGTRVVLVPDASVGGVTSYLAVRGGLAGECYLDSSSTDARGLVGGYAGRFLRAGDALAGAGLLAGQARAQPGRVRYPERVVVRLYPGPQYEAAAFEALTGSSFRVSALDRMGMRLEGPPVAMARHEVPSEGSPWGAVQVPPDGQPIVLLADRGRTGGYAKPAVVSVYDLWKLAQASPGCEVWFVAASATKPQR